MFLSDADRLAMLKAVGAEAFDTGNPEPIFAVFSAEFEEALVGDHVAATEVLELEVVSTHVAEHKLINNQKLVRVADDTAYLIKRIEPSMASGFSRIVLRR